MKLGRILVASLLTAASWQALACYTVYNANNRIMYRGENAPVDMSLPLHDTLPQRFPGGQMVFDNGSCALAPVAALAPRSSAASSAPLFTDQRTAQRIGVPYALVGRDIAMVAPRDAVVAEAALPSRITVIPGEEVHGTAMGGPPSLSQHVSRGAPADAARKSVDRR